MDQEIYDTLRNIDLMNHEEVEQATKKSNAATNPEGKDFLQEALISGSKTFDNNYQGYDTSLGNNGKNYLNNNSYNKNVDKHVDILACAGRQGELQSHLGKHSLIKSTGIGETNHSNKRFKYSNSYINDSKIPKDFENKESDLTNNQAMAEYMEKHWKQVPKLLKKEVERKRKLKLKRKEEEEKQSSLHNLVQNNDFNNEMFAKLEINKMNKPSTNIASSNGTHQYGNQAFESSKPIYANPFENYGNLDNEFKPQFPHYELPHHSYPQGQEQNPADPKEGLFKISKSNKGQNGDIYYDQFHMKEPNFVEKGRREYKNQSHQRFEEY